MFLPETGNVCDFSLCKKYRYTLLHKFSDAPSDTPIAWIGLNPSTADTNQLDPTLRRIRGFSNNWGYNSFYMLNLFAYRATLPQDMKGQEDPVGPENNKFLVDITKKCDTIICAWGNHGAFKDRAWEVLRFLPKDRLFYLEMSKTGQPKHPLYLKQNLIPIRYD